ncbi:MAG: agmatinase [Candidatus Aenigmarchaeota archaeon]|nr:agmatinase [Candidatus Aenigmarchaeota archaeon]
MDSKNIEGTPENYSQLYCSDKENAKIWFFGAPLDKTTTYLKGTAQGPKAIRDAMIQTEEYDIRTDSNILDVGLFDLGDIKLTDGNEVETIRKKTEDVLKNGKTPLMFGGEHSVTLGVIQAIKNSKLNFKVVSFDAHADLRDTFEFDKNNHACVMRRISDEIGKENILEIGIRSIAEEEKTFSDRMIFRYQLRDNFDAAKKKLLEFVKNSNVCITVDMDVFDPGIAPGVGTPEPDGLLYHEVLELIKVLKNAKKIVGMDIVELRPLPDNNVTEMTASKLLMETIAQLKDKI